MPAAYLARFAPSPLAPPPPHSPAARVLRCLLLAAALFLAACASGDAPPSDDALTDDLGRAVALPADVRHVLPLAPNLTELVVAAAGRDRLAAISPADDFPDGLEHLPRVATHPLDLERVVALAPDLILANSAVNSPRDADRLAALGVPTYFLSFTRLADVPRALRVIGELLASGEAAGDAAAEYETRLEAVRQRGSRNAEPPRTLLLIGAETLYAFWAESYTQELIAAAGGRSVTAGFSGEGVTLSEEFVLDARPEVIIGAWGEDFDPEALLAGRPGWRDLPAARDGRIHGLDPDLLLRPGPRLVLAAEQLADLLITD
jgi:iron complex transport system substrate-binding protein